MDMVDRLTKYPHFIALSHYFTMSTMEKAFLENIQKLHGTPKVIVSDCDLIFTSNFLIDLFSCLGTQLDGQIEVANKHLEGYLHCFTLDIKKNNGHISYWTSKMVVYNISFCSSLKCLLLWLDICILPTHHHWGCYKKFKLWRTTWFINNKYFQELKRIWQWHKIEWSSREINIIVKEALKWGIGCSWYCNLIRKYHWSSKQRIISCHQNIMVHTRSCKKIDSISYKLELPPTTKMHPIFHMFLVWTK